MSMDHPSGTNPVVSPVENLARPRSKAAEEKLWYTMPLETVFTEMGVSHGGLTSAEADFRREKYGLNELQEKGGRTVWLILETDVVAYGEGRARRADSGNERARPRTRRPR